MTRFIVACLFGIASQYAPGVMERTVAIRQSGRTAHHLPQQLPPHDGYIAVLDCQRIGEVWTVHYRGIVERLLVADCSGHAETSAWMSRNRIVGEVDYETARRWGVVGRGAPGVTVCP
jgi:hypothetical protein